MPRRLPSQALYRETMEAARGEVLELTSEIRQLHERLEQLEGQKDAVTEIYNAVRRFVDLTEAPEEFVIEYEAVGLSEEEVSLIAYPDGRNRQA